MRSISSLMLPTRALKPMPIEPSSRAGFTMTGKSMSCAESRRPRQTTAQRGVASPWKLKIFLASALSMARVRPRTPEPV